VKAREFVFDEYKKNHPDAIVENIFLTNRNERKITSYKTADRTERIRRF
jgi:hypothetical protein